MTETENIERGKRLKSQLDPWQDPGMIDDNFSRIFNSDNSDNEDFDIPSISGLLETPDAQEHRVEDPLALSLPSLNTPQHEFGGRVRDSPSDFERFTSSLEGFAPSLPGLSPSLADTLDDIDLKELTKGLQSPGPAPKTPLNLENLLDMQVGREEEGVVPPEMGEPRGPLTPPPRAVTGGSGGGGGSTSPYKTLSSENVDRIVNRLDNLISTNQSKVQYSAVPKTKGPTPPAVNPTRPSSKRPQRRLQLPPRGAKIAPKQNTLEDLATSLGITEPPPNPIAMTDPPPKSILITDSPPTRPTRAAPRGPPIVVGRMNKGGKLGAGATRSPVTVAQPVVAAGKGPVAQIISKQAAPGPGDANKKLIVPYNPPPKKNENKKFVLLPLEKLQNASPALIAQLGLDASLIPGGSKRPPGPPEVAAVGGPEKRAKTAAVEDQGSIGSGGEKGKFPINVTLPKGSKEKFKEFHGIPELLEKAKANRKVHLTKRSNFSEMENFINDFIQQNNDQVMEILFLQQNNKIINKNHNQLAKMLHIKNEEQKKLKAEVDKLTVANKRMEKELKIIKDMVKKYMK